MKQATFYKGMGLWFAFILMAVTTAAMISSCSTINKNVVRGVNAYCNEPYADRQLVRALINETLADSGHSIAVTCEGDPD